MFAGVTDEVDSDWLREYAGEDLSMEVLDGFIDANPGFEIIGSGVSSIE